MSRGWLDYLLTMSWCCPGSFALWWASSQRSRIATAVMECTRCGATVLAADYGLLLYRDIRGVMHEHPSEKA